MDIKEKLHRRDTAKSELTDVCAAAVNEWLRSTRGAHLLGASSEARRIGDGFVEVKGAEEVFFSIRIRHAM